MPLTPDMMATFAIIICTAILFVVRVFSFDLVACLVLVILGLTQIVPAELLFSGFSSDAVISLIAVMIVGAGLERSGLMVDLARIIAKRGGEQEGRIRLLLMIVSGAIAGLFRSFGSVALLLPVVTRISRRLAVSKSRFLMPVGFCAILGSTLTLLGTGPLILLNSLLGYVDANLKPFGLFEVMPIGLALLSMGILFFSYFEKYFLPKRASSISPMRSALDYFSKTYQIGDQIIQWHIPNQHLFIDLPLRDLETYLSPDMVIIGLKHEHRCWVPPLRTDVIKSGMIIAVIATEEAAIQFAKENHIHYSRGYKDFVEPLNPMVSGLCEVVVPPSSGLIGKEYHDLHMRRSFRIQVLAVNRAGQILRGQELSEATIKPGDTLGIFCEWERMSQFEKNPDYVIASSDYPHETTNRKKIPYALGFTILGFALIILGWASLPVGLLISAIGMVFSGVMTIEEAYKAVSWRNVFLLAGLIPLGIAMDMTGAGAWLVDQVLHLVVSWPLPLVLISLGVLTTLASLVLSNIGATVLLIPLTLELSASIGFEPRMMALMVAITASNSFLIPTHQANALISGPGRYTAKEFLRAGGPMTVLYLLVSTGMILLLYA